MAGLMVFIKNVVGRAQETTPLGLVFIENGATAVRKASALAEDGAQASPIMIQPSVSILNLPKLITIGVVLNQH
jgi:hypothetical protein